MKARIIIAASIVLAHAGLGTAQAQLVELHVFNHLTDGSSPSYGGVAVLDGIVYGTANNGGDHRDGTLWSFDTNSNTFTNLHNFDSASDGADPETNLIFSGDKVLGVAGGGGERDNGTIWSFDTVTNTFDKLHDFQELDDGAYPTRIVVSGTTLLGTTNGGGTSGHGTIWSFDTDTGAYTNLYDFREDTIGAHPQSAPVFLTPTTLAGTSSVGGTYGGGTIWTFELDTNTFTKLFDFNEDVNGHGPFGRVELSGTTMYGLAGSRPNSQGVLWSYDTSTDEFTNLYDFQSLTSGSYPSGFVRLGSTLFGAANEGGVYGVGTVWSFDTADNVFTKIDDFDPDIVGFPVGGIAISGSTMYGATNKGDLNINRSALWSFTALELLVGDCDADGFLTITDANCTSNEELDDFLALLVPSTLRGDTDGNGEVDFQDFLVLSAHFGQPGQYTDGDFDLDGEISFADFLILSKSFGRTASNAASVPEPQGFAMLLAALAGVAALAGRSHR